MFRVLNHSGEKSLPGISLWVSEVSFCVFCDDENLGSKPRNESYRLFRYLFGGCKTDFDLEVAVRVWRV